MSEALDGLSYICLFVLDRDGGKYHVDMQHWDELDAAYGNWIEKKIDRVLTLTCLDGGPLLIAVSRIAELCPSTPEIRQRSREQGEALKAETGFAD